MKLLVLESSIIQDFALGDSLIPLPGFSCCAFECDTLRLQRVCVCIHTYIMHMYINECN